MTEQSPEQGPPAAAVAPPPAEAGVVYTKYPGLEVTAERRTEGHFGAGWYAYIVVGGVEWVLGWKKLGGMDDDLQEIATPGFKEARAERYARAEGRPRTEPGPGA